MISNNGHVMTLANSIIGVGILAMPFCFQKCGIILSIVLLFLNNLITRISCHYLIKSSLLTRRKSFEFLAFHAFGPPGKLMVELCMIGYLIGTCIAYFVVVGDVGPQIISKMFALDDTDRLRIWVMIAVTLLCIIPLGMLKNVDSLSTVSTASIGFYFCLVVKVISDSKVHIIANDWQEHVVYWRPSGILQCLPIFSMALSCQMQLFEVVGSVANQSIEKLNGIVKNATWICTCVYISVGFFGYTAFCTQVFSGNILVNFSPSFGSDAIKIGFVLSIAFSFPLVIFPCRASIYSLIYRRGHSDASGYIPELRFKTITVFIVLLSLCIALIIPSIELVIGIVGSTIGVAICIMFPASCFRKILKKESSERNLAQLILIGGFFLMILGTYANLNAIDEKQSSQSLPQRILISTLPPNLPDINYNNLPPKNEIDNVIEKIKKNTTLTSVLNEEFKQKKIIFPELPKIESNLNRFKDNNKQPEIQPLETKEDIHENKKPSEIIGRVPPTPIQIEEPKIASSARNENSGKVVPNANGIDKDAIKKEEEIVAEEQKHKDENKSEDLKKTENELKKTKEFLEKKVDELKEELAKQNKETQNLVVEKLGEVVEKVEQIEREVHREAMAEDEKIEKIKNVSVPKIPSQDGTETVIKNTFSETKQIIEVDSPVKSPKHDEKIGELNIPKDSIIGILTKNTSKQIKNNTVYEPLSYKTGELINKVHQKIINETTDDRGPLPLALLINASQVKDVDSLKSVTSNIINRNEKLEQHIINTFKTEILQAKKNDILGGNNKVNDLTIQLENEQIKEKANIDSIRRDILEVNNDKLDEVTKSETVTKHREKREILNLDHIESNLEKENCLKDVNVKTLLADSVLNFKVQGLGRDLRSIEDGKK